MTFESSAMTIIDEINRLSVAYDKAKEYISKISSSIEQQIDLWKYRRQIILDQVIPMKSPSSSSSYDFLLPKTQRINELTIEAVEGLCRVDILIEQILRIDPKSSIPSTQTNTNSSLSDVHHPTTQQNLPVPVLRMPQQAFSGRVSALATEEKPGFKPISYPSLLNNVSRPPSINPINMNSLSQIRVPSVIRPPSSSSSSYNNLPPQIDHLPSPMIPPPTSQFGSNYKTIQPPRTKEKIRLQRIPPGTRWKEAKIDIIDSLSGFYVENVDFKVYEKFEQMQNELHDYYNDLESANQLIPMENIAIGDFGVAKFSEDNRWYRARLITCEGHNQIKIVFIDFGNIEIKSIDEFFSLHKSFTELPAQAIGCSLSEAFPPSQNDQEAIWSNETIQIFKNEVCGKFVEVYFVHQDEGTEQWPLHFVQVIVNNQSVTNLPSLRQRIELRPNRYIAEQMAPFLSQQEYILFNVPIGENDYES